ncbi:MAG: hypothetical protein DRJ65_22440 [Acidobacteria bacterium]|nr:MAG: hypothetical protein DRJ65_22440 [Acidobacteriota bacterium]
MTRINGSWRSSVGTIAGGGTVGTAVGEGCGVGVGVTVACGVGVGRGAWAGGLEVVVAQPPRPRNNTAARREVRRFLSPFCASLCLFVATLVVAFCKRPRADS